MQLKKFNSKYKLSDTQPIDTSIYSISARALANKLRDLINEGFKGAAAAEGFAYSEGYVNICVEYLGDTLRAILQAIRGRKLLHVHIAEEGEELTITLGCRGKMPICDEEIRNVIRSARNTRMEVYYDGDKIRLCAAVSREAVFALYAIDDESFVEIIKRLIFNFD